MRHSPSTEPSTSNQPQSLNSKLQRALNCLDIQLEEELARYRRQRLGHSVTPSNSLKYKQAAKIELMTIGETAANPLPPAPPQIPVGLTAQQTAPSNLEPDWSSQLAVASRSQEETLPPKGAADLSSGILYPPQEAHTLAGSTPPDDYLESSEELLRSLAREEAQVRVDRSFLESLATPLGVGSLLMLLLSSAMFGYVIMNPSSLQMVTGLFDRSKTPTAENSSTAPTPDGQAAIPNSPPLDKQEFVDLGLGNLTTLKSRGSASTTQPSLKAKIPTPVSPPSPEAAQSAPVTSPTSSNVRPVEPAPARSYSPPAPARSYSPPAPARSYTPAPAPIRSYSPPAQPYSPPAVQTAPLPPASVPRSYSPPVSAPSPTQGGGYSYKVEVPFTGDRSLEDARKVAPDAYLRPDGKIQLGATGSEAEAKTRAQELQDQGIPAEVNQR